MILAIDMAAAPPRDHNSRTPTATPAAGPRVQPFAQTPRSEDKGKTSHNTGNEYWKRMDAMFDRTISLAELSYKTTRIINIIIVGIGIVLIANSIAYTWYKQTPDAWSVFSGGLGLASFVTIFLTKPQKRIAKAMSNLIQLQMFYQSHSLEFEAISDYDWEKFNQGNRSIDELTKMNQEMERATETAAKNIQRYIEKDDKE